MSTRRARIKAVASLPVRRKNAESEKKKKNVEVDTATQNEPESRKDISEITTSLISKSPAVKNETTSVQTPTKSRRSQIRTPNLIERVSTPKSVITSISSPRRSSPLVRSASPSLKRSPVIKSTTPRLAHNALKDVNILKTPYTIETHVEGIADYNPPSIPESITDDTVLDGIVPLSNRSGPQPINVLKNEIISEYAEVLFDPIVPLPSPSKVRPKLRPAPRLPMRRNSIQGSASESEDEKRLGAPPPRQRHDSASAIQHSAPIHRELHRVRTESLQSNAPPATPGAATPQPQPPGSPLRDKLMAKSRRIDASRRMSAMKRKARREDVKRNEMTMYDLIFYNPTTNPIVVDEEDTTTVETTAPAEEPSKATEEAVDDPPEDTATPVPQIKLGPNGEIILDEKSLVIEQTEPKRKLSSSIVHESSWASSGKGRYSRTKRTADWSSDETVRFYRALAAVGTDFTLMEPMFPGRTRRELKVKFKKEEKINGTQIDKALRSQTHWDGNRLEDVFADERRVAALKAAEEKANYLEQRRREKMNMKAAREDGFRTSRAAKAIETIGKHVHPEDLTADAFIRKALARQSAKAKKPVRVAKVASTPNKTPTNISGYASLTLGKTPNTATPTATPTQQTTLTPSTLLPEMANSVESGSLVVLTVDDPNNPTKKMLQTYISHGGGKLSPVALPATLLSSVMGYMQRDTPNTVSTSSSPQFASPSSQSSQEFRPTSVITLGPSPNKRVRHNSYNITKL